MMSNQLEHHILSTIFTLLNFLTNGLGHYRTIALQPSVELHTHLVVVSLAHEPPSKNTQTHH